MAPLHIFKSHIQTNQLFPSKLLIELLLLPLHIIIHRAP
jgi:hypothetical protein